MAIGDGNAGGNSSVYWEVNGDQASAMPILAGASQATAASSISALTQAGATTGVGAAHHPARGEVLIKAHGVAGHTDTNFADIGTPVHAGKFRVRLRFRDQDLAQLDPNERSWIEARAKRMPQLNPGSPSLFLEIDVPAIHRPQPSDGSDWSDQPWEIHWEW